MGVVLITTLDNKENEVSNRDKKKEEKKAWAMAQAEIDQYVVMLRAEGRI